MFLTATELADMRSQFNEYLVDTATIRTYTRTSDGMGGYTLNYTESSIPCRIKSLSGTEAITFDRLQVKASVKILLPWDTTVKEKDKLVINGHIYEITSIMKTDSVDIGTTVLGWEDRSGH